MREGGDVLARLLVELRLQFFLGGGDLLQQLLHTVELLLHRARTCSDRRTHLLRGHTPKRIKLIGFSVRVRPESRSHSTQIVVAQKHFEFVRQIGRRLELFKIHKSARVAVRTAEHAVLRGAVAGVEDWGVNLSERTHERGFGQAAVEVLVPLKHRLHVRVVAPLLTELDFCGVIRCWRRV
jgi:hypothetical protein